jgi:hypothetical protein
MEGVERQRDGRDSTVVQNYHLPLRMPASGMGWWHDRDIGIALAADRLRWTIGDKMFEMALARITELHLSTYSLNKGTVPVCAVTFDDRSLLKIFGTGDTGLPDPGQARIYREFVMELHRRLSPDDRTRIDFTGGYAKGRYRRHLIAMYVMLVWLVILPFGLMFYARDLKPVGIVIFGAGLFWRMKYLANANAPRDYAPGDIPGDLIGPASENPA